MRHRTTHNILAAVAIAMLLAAHGLLAYTAATTKSATVDEPSHAMAAYMGRWYADWRVDPTNPPLWMRWIALGMPRSMLKIDTAAPAWPMLLDHIGDAWQWFVPILYRTPGNDPDAFLNRARLMMLPIALAVGVLIACWAWRLAGPVAAVAGTTLWALDPNFLAHGPLVKNDIAITLCLAGVALTTWALGERLTLWRLAMLTLWCGAAVATKYTGLLALPIVALLLAIRIALPTAWPLRRAILDRRSTKAAAAAAVLLTASLGSWIVIWAAYGFRYGSNPDPEQWLHLPSAATPANPLPPIDRLAMWASDRRLLPQPWIAGFIYVRSFNPGREAYLLGQRRVGGWWYYFPLATLVKTPLATLVAAAAAAAILAVGRRRRGGDRAAALSAWAAACLVVPPLVFGLVAMATGPNVGIRHILPMAPPLFMLIGVAAARAWDRWPKRTLWIGGVLAAGLALETLAAYPDFIPFFNIAAGGSRGGLQLLSDSNLDWGQDLKPLAAWRRDHPGGRLLLDYLGTADPAFYLGPDYIPLQLAMSVGVPWTRETGYLAVSATHLQGLYVPPPIARMYRMLNQQQRPAAIVGGSIYIYRLPLPPLPPLSPPQQPSGESPE